MSSEVDVRPCPLCATPATPMDQGKSAFCPNTRCSIYNAEIEIEQWNRRAADAASPGRQDDVRDAVVEQARNLFQTFSGGMNVCLKCGKEETTTNWDYVQDLGSALAALDAETAPPAGKVTP